MGKFADEVRSSIERSKGKMDLVIRKVALELFQRVILRSPVDSGRFRGNWQVAIGNVPAGTLELEDKSGTATVNKIQAATLGLKAGQIIYLANNLPYAQRLEDGHSGQAPAGMVALTAQEFRQIAEQIGVEVRML